MSDEIEAEMMHNPKESRRSRCLAEDERVYERTEVLTLGRQHHG